MDKKNNIKKVKKCIKMELSKKEIRPPSLGDSFDYNLQKGITGLK